MVHAVSHCSVVFKKLLILLRFVIQLLHFVFVPVRFPQIDEGSGHIDLILRIYLVPVVTCFYRRYGLSNISLFLAIHWSHTVPMLLLFNS
jgi:hypothetical protein